MLLGCLLLGAQVAAADTLSAAATDTPGAAATDTLSAAATDTPGAPASPGAEPGDAPASVAATPPPGAAPAEEPVAPAAPSELEVALAGLLDPMPYAYRSAGRRDPFVALVQMSGEIPDDQLPAVGEFTVVGILWSERGRSALAETITGRSLVLRANDRIRGGRVLEVTEGGIVVRYSRHGETHTVTLPIASAGENRDER